MNKKRKNLNHNQYDALPYAVYAKFDDDNLAGLMENEIIHNGSLSELEHQPFQICPICERSRLKILGLDFTECDICFSSFSQGHSFTFPLLGRHKGANLIRAICIKFGIEGHVPSIRKWARKFPSKV